MSRLICILLVLSPLSVLDWRNHCCEAVEIFPELVRKSAFNDIIGNYYAFDPFVRHGRSFPETKKIKKPAASYGPPKKVIKTIKVTAKPSYPVYPKPKPKPIKPVSTYGPPKPVVKPSSTYGAPRPTQFQAQPFRARTIDPEPPSPARSIASQPAPPRNPKPVRTGRLFDITDAVGERAARWGQQYQPAPRRPSRPQQYHEDERERPSYDERPQLRNQQYPEYEPESVSAAPPSNSRQNQQQLRQFDSSVRPSQQQHRVQEAPSRRPPQRERHFELQEEPAHFREAEVSPPHFPSFDRFFQEDNNEAVRAKSDPPPLRYPPREPEQQEREVEGQDVYRHQQPVVSQPPFNYRKPQQQERVREEEDIFEKMSPFSRSADEEEVQPVFDRPPRIQEQEIYRPTETPYRPAETSYRTTETSYRPAETQYRQIETPYRPTEEPYRPTTPFRPPTTPFHPEQLDDEDIAYFTGAQVLRRDRTQTASERSSYRYSPSLYYN